MMKWACIILVIVIAAPLMLSAEQHEQQQQRQEKSRVGNNRGPNRQKRPFWHPGNRRNAQHRDGHSLKAENRQEHQHQQLAKPQAVSFLPQRNPNRDHRRELQYCVVIIYYLLKKNYSKL